MPTSDTTTKPTTESTQTTIYMDNTTNRSIYPKEINNYIGGKKQSRFSPPTLDEVQAYCKERGNNVDAERFIDYYTSKGWMIGKNKMKDWKASVRTWERNSTKTTAQANLGADERIENGRRTYGSGSATIPMTAPPRPSARHAWNASTEQWVVY